MLLAVAVLIGSLALYGCPKRPEVMQAAPAPSRIVAMSFCEPRS